MAENAGRKRIQEKVHHVGHNRFRAFALDRIDDLIVRRRMEFDEDFSDYADARFFDRQKRERIEIVDDVFCEFVKAAHRKRAQLNFRPAVPFFVKRVRRALHFFVGARAVQNAHEHVSYHRTHDKPFEECERHFKSRILFETVRVQRQDGDVPPARIVQSAPDKADVVRRAAAAAGLRDDEGRVIQIVLARFEGGDHLPRDEDRRITRVVVDESQTDIDGARIDRVEHDEFIAGIFERFLKEAEVDRRHLRRDDRMRVLHLFRKHLLLIRGALYDGLLMAPLALLYRGDERADAYAHRAQVCTLIDFNKRIHASLCAHDFVDLIGGNRVKPAAETRQLHEFEIRHTCDKGSRAVQSIVIRPLIDDAKRPLDAAQMRDAVFGKNRKSQIVYEFGNAVIDFGIEVIRTTCEHDAVCAAPDRFFDRFDTLLFRIAPELFLFRPRFVHRARDALFRQFRKVRNELFGQAHGEAVFIVNRQKRIHVQNGRVLPERIDIVAQHFGIACDDGTIIVIARSRIFLQFVGRTGIENKFYTLQYGDI